MGNTSTQDAPRRHGPPPHVVTRIARVIQARLVAGEYPPDTYLPSERELARDLRVARTSIAAAVRNLTDLGLVERHPGRGSYIRPKAKKTISIIHTVFPGNDPVWIEATNILQGARDRLAPGSLPVLEENRRKWVDAPPPAVSDQTSGLLFVEIQDEILHHVRALLASGIPCVVANLEQEYPDLPASYIDHRGVAEQATRLLIGMGHRRIGYVGNQPAQWFYTASLGGYKRALEESGIAPDPQMIELRSDPMSLAGFLGARALLQRSNPPTAIVAARDGYAEGVVKAAEEAGLVVGRELSVIGYDDLTWPKARDFLTTFAQPAAQIGSTAAEILLEWIFSGERPASRKIDTPLIMRRSVGPAPSPRPAE